MTVRGGGVPQEAPGKLDHSLPHPSIAGSREPLLAALAPAFVGRFSSPRAREPAVACHGAAVAQVAQQDLLDQHVRGLDAKCRSPASERGPSDLVQPLVPASVVPGAPSRSGGSARRRAAFGPGRGRRLLERRIEAANAKARQDALMRLMMVVCSPTRVSRSRGASGILLCEGRDRAHLAVVPFAAQPAEKGPFELLKVGLGAGARATRQRSRHP
jgi:hypothetical protein